jgi:hypothetical protein
MKSYIYLLLFALALPSVPLANAGQAEDPELANAHQAFDEALICVPPPYVSVECVTLAGGSVVTKFTKVFGDQIIAQAIQDGSSPREWRVYTNPLSCGSINTGFFASKGQGFHPWKSDILNFCTACVNDSTCLSLLP